MSGKEKDKEAGTECEAIATEEARQQGEWRVPSKLSTTMGCTLSSNASSGWFCCSTRELLDVDSVMTLRTRLEVLLKVENLCWDHWDGSEKCVSNRNLVFAMIL